MEEALLHPSWLVGLIPEQGALTSFPARSLRSKEASIFPTATHLPAALPAGPGLPASLVAPARCGPAAAAAQPAQPRTALASRSDS